MKERAPAGRKAAAERRSAGAADAFATAARAAAASFAALALLYWFLGARTVELDLFTEKFFRRLYQAVFTAVVVGVAQSAVDFGLHVPAVAVLATTVAAYLCMAGSDAADSWRVGRLGSVAGAVLRQGHASAVLAASIFHYGEYSVGEAKRHMAAAGLPMRLDP